MSSLKTLVKLLSQTTQLSRLFFLLCLVLLAENANAQSPYFYQDEALEISFPENIELSPCSAALAQKAGYACQRLGKDGQKGVAFLTITEGYAIHHRQDLETHLLASERSLQDIPRITVMQTRILDDKPLIGLLEILREDDAVLEVTELSIPPLRQSSFLIPLGSKLAQVFVYLSLSDPQAPELHAKLLAELPQGIHVKIKIDPNAKHNDTNQRKKSSLSLLPIALSIGGLLALIVIIALSLSHFLAQKKRAQKYAAPNEIKIKLDDLLTTPKKQKTKDKTDHKKEAPKDEDTSDAP